MALPLDNLYLGIEEPAPKIIGQCAYCMDAIYEGSECYSSGGIMVHTQCFADYVQEEYTETKLAGALGFEQRTE